MSKTMEAVSAPRSVTRGNDPTVAVVGAATLLVLVTFTTIATTVGLTAASFHASVGWQTWALGGMSLGLAGALLTAGGMADTLGRRRVFVLSGVALAVSSAVTTAAPSMPVFVAGRILQGVAGAGLLAAGLGLIGHAFPGGPARTRATGTWGAMLGAGIALGPLLGAGLAVFSGWRAAYGLETLAAIALVRAGLLLPESHGVPSGRRPGAAGGRRPDPPGALTMLVAMGCLAAGLTAGRTGWTAPATITLLAVGGAALGVFVAIEAVRPDPMLDLALFGRPLFLASVGGAAVTGLGMIGLMSYSPTLMERGLGSSPLTAGGVMAIWSTTSMVVAMQARRLPVRFGGVRQLVVGLALNAVGCAALAWLDPGSSWVRLAPGLLVAGIGSGLANAALGGLAVESVPSGSAALGSGANNTARYFGSALGIALTVILVSGGGPGQGGLLDGWDHAALVAALLNVAGAVLALACRRR